MHTHTPAPGEGLVRQLKWVHDLIRHDLGVVRGLADEVHAGLAADDAKTALRSLRIDCVRHCRFIHMHHTLESAELFPALKRSNPALAPVVDKLDADHRQVSIHLAEVEAACDALARDHDPAARARLVAGLRALATDLLAHLDFEEEHISPTLRTWDGWPS
jgi:hemerythrin-like domain-containing protein